MQFQIPDADWSTITNDLDKQGHAIIPSLLSPQQCKEIIALYAQPAQFRSRITMERYNFGKGEYQYFRYPLPDIVANLREQMYPPLATIASHWNQLMKIDVSYPSRHADFVAQCHAAGQVRPTPLLLRYDEGDYNCLHQDLYGELVFPLQLAILLSEPGRDFSGGEFVLTEQRPRMQSRADVVPLRQGDAVVFSVHQRPVQGARGIYRVNMRHGVSRLRGGQRYTLGLIFHDAP